MKKHQLLIILFLLYFCQQGMADTGKTLPNIMSPDVATLGKYGAYNVSHYTGTPDISIPLYKFDLRGKSIPLYISYDASGFLPNKNAGIVGQNWTMMAGGLITRTVNGIPDEQEQTTYENALGIPFYMTYGYWYGINKKESPKSGDFIKNLTYLIPNSSGLLGANLSYEHTPDLFTFNFCGHSGQFIIGNDGKVKVISDEFYSVDLSGLTYQNDTQPIKASQIKIITNDGYEFTFGGSLNSMEINLKSYSKTTATKTKDFFPSGNGTVSSWYLTKIKAPNGEEVNFIYDEQDVSQFLLLVNNGGDRNYLEKIYYNFDSESGYFCTKSSDNNFNLSDPRKLMSFVKICYLKEINFPSGKIKFDYSEKQKPFYGKERLDYWRNASNKTGVNTNRLDKISISGNDNTLKKTILFTYNYYASQDTSCHRMFLTNLSVDDQKYSFGYQPTTSLPAPLTSSIDFWGYYNGNTSRGNSLLPIVSNDISDPFDVDVSFRKTNKDNNCIGMLSKITYPTGGYTNFVFETHEYGTIFKRTKNSGINPEKITEAGFAGGVRIKQIIKSSGETINYAYKNQDGSSSGILINNNIYHASMRYNTATTCGDQIICVVASDNIISATSIQESHIAYSQVRETANNKENGYTDYYYTSHLTHPDVYTLGAGTYRIVSDNLLNISNFEMQMKRLMKYSSQERERGKLIKLVMYNSSDAKVKEEYYKYNEDPNRAQKAVYSYNIPFWNSNRGVFHSYAIYYYPNYLTQKRTIDYSGSNKIETEENYAYEDTYNLLKEVKSKTSQEDLITKQYFYPSDFAITTPYNEMVLKNILSPVVQEIEYKNSDMTNFIKKTVNNYSKFHNLFYAVSNQQVQNGNNQPLDAQVAYEYDPKGNLRQVTGSNADKVSYLWGYNYQYPIAEIKNASFTDIKDNLGVDPETLATAASPNMTNVDGLRAKLPTALVTTYTYQPLVGMQTSKDPRGVITSFEYDPFGRLITVKNHNGNIVKDYFYKYKN